MVRWRVQVRWDLLQYASTVAGLPSFICVRRIPRSHRGSEIGYGDPSHHDDVRVIVSIDYVTGPELRFGGSSRG